MPAVPERALLTTARPEAERPSRRALGWLVAAVLALHLALLLSLTGALDWRLQSADPVRVAPLQTRWVPPVPAPSVAPAAPSQPRTRIATETVPAPRPAPAASTVAATTAQESATPPPTEEAADKTPTDMAQAPHAALTPEAAPGTPPNPQPTATPAPTPESGPVANTTPAKRPTAFPPTASPDATSPPPSVAANAALPPIPVGALPPPVLLSYRLTGQDKGLTYHANGELKWQHNDSAYALSLSVKAFLVGSRHWRSQGEITGAGLAPSRFSDSWRSERATHFDRANQRVVFSSNAPVAALEAGAQDQISLYVQLAAAMAGAPERFQPGTRLQVQTVTVRDALPWLLTLEPPETLALDGQDVPTVKWVCQPRNRFDAKVEFWVAARYAWMPVRIRITQVSGSFIDLVLRGQEALPPLPAVAPAG